MMWAALITFVTGFVAWILAQLVFEPMKAVTILRREAQERLIIHGNIGGGGGNASEEDPQARQDRQAAYEAYRRIGAGLVAWHLSTEPLLLSPVRWVCRWLRWDIHQAGSKLISLGNSISLGQSASACKETVDFIRQHLALPTPPVPLLMRQP